MSTSGELKRKLEDDSGVGYGYGGSDTEAKNSIDTQTEDAYSYLQNQFSFEPTSLDSLQKPVPELGREIPPPMLSIALPKLEQNSEFH
jgi:hypothetical protein